MDHSITIAEHIINDAPRAARRNAVHAAYNAQAAVKELLSMGGVNAASRAQVAALALVDALRREAHVLAVAS